MIAPFTASDTPMKNQIDSDPPDFMLPPTKK
jgi:hypothetical protein